MQSYHSYLVYLYEYIFFYLSTGFIYFKFVWYNRAKFHVVIVTVIVDTDGNFVLIAKTYV
jgi:hypothetical protein